MVIVWKVVRAYNCVNTVIGRDHMISMYAPTNYCNKYEIGVRTIAKKGTKLFVFRTFADAKNFAGSSCVVLKCKTGRIRLSPEYIAPGSYNEAIATTYNYFWKIVGKKGLAALSTHTRRGKKLRWISCPPIGTLMVDWVEPVEIAYKRPTVRSA